MDHTPAALVGLDDVAAALGLPPKAAREYLETRHDHPVASYQGRPLWLADTVQDALAERAVRAERAARAEFERTNVELAA
jgi:hypothetical protein